MVFREEPLLGRTVKRPHPGSLQGVVVSKHMVFTVFY